MMSNNQESESSRVYYLFYTFFLIPLMICVFGVLFVLITQVLTFEPKDINQLQSGEIGFIITGIKWLFIVFRV